MNLNIQRTKVFMLRNSDKIKRNWHDTKLRSNRATHSSMRRWVHWVHNPTSNCYKTSSGRNRNHSDVLHSSLCTTLIVPFVTFLLGWTYIMFTTEIEKNKQIDTSQNTIDKDTSIDSNNGFDRLNSILLATSSSKSATKKMIDRTIQQQNDNLLHKLDENTKPSQVVDFIVIGNGNTGRSAIKTINEKCPNASILVIDPLSIHPDTDYNNNNDRKSNWTLKDRFLNNHNCLQYMLGSAISFDHTKQTVDILQNQTFQQQNHNSDKRETTPHQNMIQRIKYKHSLLIATGSRAAIPPSSSIDERAKERILEYRSTQQFIPLLLRMNNNDIHKSHKNYMGEQMKQSQIYPALSRVAVRQIALMAASQGSKICILGSGVEAMELAASVAEVQRTYGHSNHMKNNNSNNSNTNNKNNNSGSVSLIFGNAGPLVNILPRYLSTAVTKRLRSHSIDVEERSLVRYISSSSTSKSNINGGEVLHVHLVKSFDDLDTKRCQADLLICK